MANIHIVDSQGTIHCTLCQQFYERYPVQNGHHVLSSRTFASAIKCAFPDGAFSSENHNCQTMIALRDMAERDTRAFRAWNDDISLGVLPLPSSVDEGMQTGYLVMLWYKDRGRTAQAWVMEYEMAPELLRLTTAEALLAR